MHFAYFTDINVENGKTAFSLKYNLPVPIIIDSRFVQDPAQRTRLTAYIFVYVALQMQIPLSEFRAFTILPSPI